MELSRTERIGPGAPASIQSNPTAINSSLGLFGSGYRDPTKPDPILDNMPKYNKYDPAAREAQHRVEGLDFGAEEYLIRGI